MMPIDPPREGASPEELARWLREFSENYNRLLDDVQNIMKREEVNTNHA